MQDSSTNPYIPQQSDNVQAATEKLSSPLKRTVKLLSIVTATLAILVGAGLFFVTPRTSVESAEARVDLANTIQPPEQLAKLVPVKSTLGFKLSYDNKLFTSYAETIPPIDEAGKKETSSYYENDDLRTVRDYSVVRITPFESTEADRAVAADPPQLVVSSPMTLKEVKANEGKADYKGLSQVALFVQVSRDAKLTEKLADDGTTVSMNATKAASKTINDVKYQWIRYTTKNENYRIVTYKYDDCYYTIQNDVPISACVTNVRPNSKDDAALIENVLSSLSFHKPSSETATASIDSKATSSTTKTTSRSEGNASSKEERLALEDSRPEYHENFTQLSVLAKNQPSAVRIGMLYCADLSLKAASGSVVTTLTDACVGNLASGTFVSRDGYIATTGHATRVDPKTAIGGYINFADSQKELSDRLDRVLEYLLKSRLILESDAQYLRTGVQVGDQEALAKIENIGSLIPDAYVTPTKDNYSYAIQPTDKPVTLDTATGSRPVFAYSDTVLEAKFVAADYEAEKSFQHAFDSQMPNKDIGLLKASGVFQNVALAQGSQVKTNDTVIGIGYPSFSGKSLVIGSNQNNPTVLTAKVGQVYNKDDQQLIQIDSPVTPGASGAGVYNEAGELIGLSVYGISYCPDQLCFATGTVRPVSELIALLDTENIAVTGLSDATKQWSEAVDKYFSGNYSAAQRSFAQAGELYAFNNLASPLQKLTESKKGSSSDTSLMNQISSMMIVVLVIMITLTIIFTILFLLQKRRLDTLHTGRYGIQPSGPSAPSMASAPVVPPQQPSIQRPFAPQQPQSSYYPPQPQVQPSEAAQQFIQPRAFEQTPASQPMSAQEVHVSPSYGQSPQAPPSPQAPVSPQSSGAVEDPFYRR